LPVAALVALVGLSCLGCQDDASVPLAAKRAAAEATATDAPLDPPSSDALLTPRMVTTSSTRPVELAKSREAALRVPAPSPVNTIQAQPLAASGAGSYPPLVARSRRSDLNRDGLIDLQDVVLFSERTLRQDWQTVDWCGWLETPYNRKSHRERNFLRRHREERLSRDGRDEELLFFIEHYFQCHPLSVAGANVYPTRMAWGPDGMLYVSDALVGSVFVYDVFPELTPVGELKRLSKPLGVAVDASGAVYVGVDGRDRVEVYDADGTAIRTIGDGTIRMPNDLAFDSLGDLYVVDSQSNRIWVYDAGGAFLRSIGVGELSFPVALEISGAELYVADQGSSQIKVFDLDGTLLRALGGSVRQGSLGYSWKGKFVRLQSLAIDAKGRLHALDSHQGLIEILDPVTGSYSTSYGEKGTGPGQLRLALDIASGGPGEMAVTDAENRRVEILPTP
jgi:sugar lactone lactonase YvrE